jgi:hypothetical protein
MKKSSKNHIFQLTTLLQGQWRVLMEMAEKLARAWQLRRKYWLYTKCTECQACCPVVGIGPPAFSSPSECCFPPLGPRGETQSLEADGEGGTNVDEGTDPHRKKRFTSFMSPAGMSLTKLPLGRNNSVMTSLFPPRESLVVTSRLGTGNLRTFFLQCRHSGTLYL